MRDLPWLRALASRLARGDVDVADDLVRLGQPSGGLDDEAWREQMFESVMLAHVPEGVHACDPAATVAGVLRFEIDFAEGSNPAAVRIDGPDMPLDVVACVRSAATQWRFPRKFVGRTMSHVVMLPIERDAMRASDDL